MYDAFEVLFSFGALMWRAGSTAIRTREWMEVLAKKMGFESMAVGLSLENMTVSARGPNGQITAMRAVAPQSLNARRIAELEDLARAAAPGLHSASSNPGPLQSRHGRHFIHARRLPVQLAWRAVASRSSTVPVAWR